jgi:hypothetical protein
MTKKRTTEQFIELANNVHNSIYDYSAVCYINAHSKIHIICKTHGMFTQIPHDHLSGSGCPKCAQIKRELTWIKNHGVDNPFKSNIIQKKCQQTWHINHGVYNPMKSLEVREKYNISCLANNGVLWPFQSSTIREKSKQTWKYNIGVDNPSKDIIVKNKKVKTCNTNFGVNYPGQIHISSNTLKLLSDVEYLYNEHHENKNTISKIADNLKISQPGLCTVFNRHNIEMVRFSGSQGERDIIEFIKVHNIPNINNTRTVIPPLELDIYLPDHNIAIEYNGLYWHSELADIDKNYHLNKTQLCQEKGIRLIHIFENEWILQPEIVKSRLLSILHKNASIYARKCTIIQLTSKQSREFFNTTHIQGSANASVCYGLMYNNELVAAMSFGKSRFNKSIEWELVRYSNKLNYSVVGGASKLFQHFIKQHNPGSVISYSDKRWNTGGLYLQLGFQHSHSSTPNYFYFKKNSNILLSRQQFQKHKLKDKLEIFDPTLTEWQNMVNNGYNRIWDCGNLVFVY